MDLIKDLDKLIESKIDRSKWQKCKFSDLVENINEKVVPKDSGLEHYIGLEHLDSGSLHIRRFGETKSLVGDKLKIYKGDIIFAKRNAYLKRVAVAQFDAVASAHSLVLRPKQINVEPGFLAVYLMSESFWSKAIEISVGSLSPTINWPALAKQEFKIPPKDQQVLLLKLFSSLDECIEVNISLKDSLLQLRNILLKKFSSGSTDWHRYKVKNLMKFNYGKALKETDRIEGKCLVVSSSGVQGTHNDYLVEGPGIVVGRKGNVGEVTWVEVDFWPIDTAYYVEINHAYKQVPMKFFYYLLEALNLKSLSISTAVPGLNREDAMDKTVFLPNSEEIFRLFDEIEITEQTTSALVTKINELKQLQFSFINQIF